MEPRLPLGWIRVGAVVDKANNDDGTALKAASIKVHADVAETLIQAGPDIDIAADNGFTNLMIARRGQLRHCKAPAR